MFVIQSLRLLIGELHYLPRPIRKTFIHSRQLLCWSPAPLTTHLSFLFLVSRFPDFASRLDEPGTAGVSRQVAMLDDAEAFWVNADSFGPVAVDLAIANDWIGASVDCHSRLSMIADHAIENLSLALFLHGHAELLSIMNAAPANERVAVGSNAQFCRAVAKQFALFDGSDSALGDEHPHFGAIRNPRAADYRVAAFGDMNARLAEAMDFAI